MSWNRSKSSFFAVATSACAVLSHINAEHIKKVAVRLQRVVNLDLFLSCEYLAASFVVRHGHDSLLFHLIHKARRFVPSNLKLGL